ncbi:uncharacterized protein [Coffea arabica]|uniref:Uncharacterized protein n=1 Tax=Coffea arabica TaxID=13443 RepID=A0A6P6T1F3_COFAR|nr:uncharacterized protein LOC113696737 [Coffea arabica]
MSGVDVRPIDVRPIKLSYDLKVKKPPGNQSLIANLMYRNCEVWVGDQKLLADLIGLSIKGYDVILGIRVRRLLSKGVQGYLAFLINTLGDKVRLEDMLVVKEYPDIFFEELESLPPEREIAFKIDVVPGVAPISKTPYRIAPTELKELKLQLQDLLEQDFIRENYSP